MQWFGLREGSWSWKNMQAVGPRRGCLRRHPELEALLTAGVSLRLSFHQFVEQPGIFLLKECSVAQQHHHHLEPVTATPGLRVGACVSARAPGVHIQGTSYSPPRLAGPNATWKWKQLIL